MPETIANNTNQDACIARQQLIAALEPHVAPTRMHPEGYAVIRSDVLVVTYKVAIGLVEVHDLRTADCLFRSGSQSAYCRDLFVPGEWLEAITGAQVAAA